MYIAIAGGMPYDIASLMVHEQLVDVNKARLELIGDLRALYIIQTSNKATVL